MKQSTSFAQVATNLLNVLQGYTKGIRFVAVLTMLLIVGIGQAWAETYSYTFTAKQFSANGSKTLNSVSWTLAGNGNYWGYEATKGQQFGSGSAPYKTLTLSTSGISGTITKIIINTSGAKDVNASFTVSVGGTQWGNSTKLTTTATDYTFTGSKSGEIKFSYTQTSSKALYIKSISVTYETAVATVPVTGVSLNTSKLTLTEGDSETLTATVAPANATDKTVTWTTNNSSVATVSNGKVTAVAEGSAIITVTTNDGKKTATCNVTVNPKPKYTVTLVPGSGSVSSTTLTEASAGAGVTLPTPTLDCGDWDFAGWAEESVNAETTTKPTLIPAGAYNPASNITLYAVYQRTETTNGGGNSVSESITIEPNTFPDKGTSSYASGAERTGAVNEISLGGHYITGNQNNTPTGSIAGTYLQCQAKNATIYNKTKLPGNITKVVINQYDAKAFSLYCGSEQLMASNNTSTEQTPSGTKINDVTAATKMTWDVSGDYTYFALKKGSNTGYVTSIVVTYTTSGGASTTYYHSTPECAAPCTDPGLAYAIASVTKTVGDAAFTNPLTNNKNVSVTYTSTKTDVATVDNNGQVKIKAVGETTIKATWAGNADYCADEASYTLTVLPKTYTITVANNISNGSVSADKSSAVEGATIKLTATPNTGYKLGTWNIKDASNNPVSVNENGEFTMPASNVTVSATFVSLPKLATPSELSATEINPTSATLNWKWLENTYAAQLSYYYLYIKKEGDANFTGPITYTSTSCSRTNLEPNTKYIWKVQAISKDKTIVLTSEESTPSSFTTAALPTYTVSFSTGTGNPTQADVIESVGGQGITLPVGPAPACTDWTFAGWAEAIVTETTTEPTLFAEGTNYKPASNCTLYAVYSTTAETTGFIGYEKVTEEPEDWSGKYLLSTGTYTANGTYDSNGANGHLVRETYTPGNEEKAEWEFTLAKVDNTRYSILFPDGSSYLGYASSTNFARSATVVSSDNVAYLWTPSTSGITNVSATSRKIADNGSADFRPYSSPSSGIVYLYKRIGGGAITTYNSNPDCTPPSEYTITWWANGEEYHTQTAVEGTAIDVPTNSPNAATYACDDKVFVGWVDTEIIGSTDTKPTLITDFDKITENKDFFAVFATEEGEEETTTKVFETGEIGKNGNSITSGYVLIAQASAQEGYYQDGTGGDKRYIQVSKVDKSTPMMLSNPSSVVIKANLGGGSAQELTNPVYAVWLDVNGNEMGNAVIVTNEITNKTGSDFIVSLPVANATEAYGIRVYHQKESGYNVRYYGISLSYTYNTTTYSGYVTTCEKPTYTRVVKPGEYGTICLPYGSSDYTGAEFYEVSSVEYGKGLWLDQLAAGTALAAGKPYIFRATAEKLAVVYKGEKKDSPVDGVNGLTGTFTAIAANSTLVGHFIIAKNQIWVANDKNTLPAYRAYINAEDVPTTAQAQLPGRRRVCMGENAATGLDNITNGENNTIKVIENGQLFIIRNGEKYNIQGQKL